MRTIQCPNCHYEIAEDDFITQQRPICDSYMPLNRLYSKAESGLGSISRINPVQTQPLVDCD